MIILIIFELIAATSLVGLVMASATHKTIVNFDHGWFVKNNWSDFKVHSVGAGITVIGVVLMLAIIASMLKRRGGPRL